MKPHSRLRPNFTFQCLVLSSIAMVGVLPVNAQAQAQPPQAKNEFTVQRFDPAPGPRNFFQTRTARSDGKNVWSAGFVAGYGSNPLVINSCVGDGTCLPGDRRGDLKVVKAVAGGDVLGSFTPMPALQLGLRLPVIFVNGQGLDADGSGVPGGTKKTALGDPAVEAKYRFFGDLTSPFAAAGAVFVTAPLGHAMAKGAYIGDQSPTFGLRGIADIRRGDFSAAANLIGMWRSTAQIGESKIGPELRYALAVGYNVIPAIRVLVEGVGNTRISTKKDGSNGMEILLGGQITPEGSPLTVTLGGGAGVIDGVGIPGFRLFGGLLYSAEPRDRDHDGVLDDADQCPVAAEDFDGFEDSDGCPDADNDGDRFPDSEDKCPSEAEDMDGFEDKDGCPEPDNDRDGVNDDHDSCPDKAETKNGYKDDDGCPDEADSDADGVPDASDKCPSEAEDTDGFEDTDGCPDLDNDNDGIPDSADECSEEAETMNGFEDNDGCPDEDPKDKGKKKK